MESVLLKGHAVVEIVDAPEPVPGPGEVLVETRISALCGSELHVYRESGQPEGNPGHESAGVIVELGEGVTGLTVGQRVAGSAVSGCGHCEYCAKGQYTWCPNFVVYGNRHAERFVVAARACHPLPDDVSWEAGVLIGGDGFGVPYHTSTKLRDDRIGTIAIFGLGPIGLGNLMMQTYLGRRVIGVDVVEARLGLARALGCEHTIDAAETEDVVGVLRHLTDGLGPEACIEAAGRPETVKQCFSAVRTGGIVVFNGEQPRVELSPSQDFIRRDITAVGSWFYHFCEFPAMLELYRARLPVERLITHRLPLTQAGEGYRLMAAGQTGKVVLIYGA